MGWRFGRPLDIERVVPECRCRKCPLSLRHRIKQSAEECADFALATVTSLGSDENGLLSVVVENAIETYEHQS